MRTACLVSLVCCNSGIFVGIFCLLIHYYYFLLFIQVIISDRHMFTITFMNINISTNQSILPLFLCYQKQPPNTGMFLSVPDVRLNDNEKKEGHNDVD